MTAVPNRSALDVTRLDDRNTPSAVTLDPTFGVGGRFVLSDSINLTGAPLPRVVEALPDGRVVVGTTVTAANGDADFGVFRLTADGTLDPTFGTNGVATIPFDAGGANTDVLNALIVLPDGRIVVAGYAELAGGDTDFAAARLTADGKPDLTFGGTGKLLVAFDRGGQNRDGAQSLAVDSVGRVVLGGYSEGSANFDFAAVRLTAVGALDTTFNATGKATVGFDLPGGTGDDKAAAVAVGPGDSVLLAGSANRGVGVTASAFTRLTAAGTLDASFGTAGRTTLAKTLEAAASANAAAALVVLADGHLLVAGTAARATAADTDFYTARLTATGQLDATYGTGGFVGIAFDRGGANADVANALRLDAAGNALVAGSVELGGGDFDFGLARVTPAGALDASFGRAGLTTVAFDRGGAKSDAATGVAVAADGRLLLAGLVETTAGEFDAGVARLQLDSGLPSQLLVSGNGSAATSFDLNAAGQYAAGTSFAPFGSSASLVRTAVGDVNGDGVPDRIYAVGPGGGSLIRVVDGATGADLLAATATYEATFTGGLFVASADIDGDGRAEIVVSPDVGGGGRVQIFDVQAGALVTRANFFGIDDTGFRGGARVAVGDVNGDGFPDLVVAAGFGGGPRVALFDGRTALAQPNPTRLTGDFFAFPGEDAVRLRNGVVAAVGDLNGDGKAELIFGGGPGGGPRVFALDGSLLLASGPAAAQAAPVANFFVGGDTASRGGVRLAVKDLDGDGRADLIAASGEGLPARVRVYLGRSFPAAGEPSVAQDFAPFGGATLDPGVFVG